MPLHTGSHLVLCLYTQALTSFYAEGIAPKSDTLPQLYKEAKSVQPLHPHSTVTLQHRACTAKTIVFDYDGCSKIRLSQLRISQRPTYPFKFAMLGNYDVVWTTAVAQFS
jgi:hypothetical protein